MTNNAESTLATLKTKNAERQARAREKKKKEGLKQITVWIPEDEYVLAKAKGWQFGGIWWSAGQEIGLETGKIVVENAGKIIIKSTSAK